MDLPYRSLVVIFQAPNIDESIRKEACRLFLPEVIVPISAENLPHKRLSDKIQEPELASKKTKKHSEALQDNQPKPDDSVKVESPTAGIIFDEFKSSGLNLVLLGEIQEIYNAGVVLQKQETSSNDTLKNRILAIIRNLICHAMFLASPFLENTTKAISKGLATHFSYGIFHDSELLNVLFSFLPDSRQLKRTLLELTTLKANFMVLLVNEAPNLAWHLLNFMLCLEDNLKIEYFGFYNLFMDSMSKIKLKSKNEIFVEHLQLCRDACFDKFPFLCIHSLSFEPLNIYTQDMKFVQLLASSLSPSHIAKIDEIIEVQKISMFSKDSEKCCAFFFDSLSWENLDQVLLWDMFSSQILIWSPALTSSILTNLISLVSQKCNENTSLDTLFSGILQVISLMNASMELVHRLLRLSKRYESFVFRAVLRIIRKDPPEFLKMCTYFLKHALNLSTRDIVHFHSLSFETNDERNSLITRILKTICGDNIKHHISKCYLYLRFLILCKRRKYSRCARYFLCNL